MSVMGALIAFQDGIGPQTNCMFGARGRTEVHDEEPLIFSFVLPEAEGGGCPLAA